MEPYLGEQFYNPSAAYQASRQVKADYENARHRLAMAIGGAKEEIILTAGATESIANAFQGVLARGGHVVIGATEHAAVRGTAAQYPHAIAASDGKGIISPDAVRAAITSETRLVSVTLADSELGTVQKLRDIAEVIAEERATRRSEPNLG